MYKTWRYVFGGTIDQRTLALMSGTVRKKQERTEVLPENEPCNSGAGKRQLTVLLRYVRLATVDSTLTS